MERTHKISSFKFSKNALLRYFYSPPLHTLASEKIFSADFLQLYTANRDLIHSFVDNNTDLMQILKGMDCTYHMVFDSDNWQSIFASEPPGYQEVRQGRYWYGRQFEGCADFELRIVDERFTQRELYVLFWKLFHENDAVDKAKALLDQEIDLLTATMN